ncbi:hypothetical protein HN873_049845 [Arachis hypogaea]
MLAGPVQRKPGRVESRKRKDTRPAQDVTAPGMIRGGDGADQSQGRSACQPGACRAGCLQGNVNREAAPLQSCAGMMKDNGAVVEQFVNGGYGDGGGDREWNGGNHEAVYDESRESETLGFEEHVMVPTVLEVGGFRVVDEGENTELRVGRGQGHEEAVGGEEGVIGDVSDDGNYGDIDGENGSKGENRARRAAENQSRIDKEDVVTVAGYGGCGSKIGQRKLVQGENEAAEMLTGNYRAENEEEVDDNQSTTLEE